jgi:ADP-ribose pyrophosphatase
MGTRRVNVNRFSVPLDLGFLRVSRSEFTYTLPTGAEREQMRLVVDRGNAVAALLHEPARGLLHFVKQFRFPTYNEADEPAAENGWLLELIAGVVSPNETAAEAITREVEEETGIRRLVALEMIGSFYLTPGASNERLFLYYAQVETDGFSGAKSGLGVDDEWIEVISMTPKAFLEKVEAMLIYDAKTIAAAEFVRRRPDLFSRGG